MLLPVRRERTGARAVARRTREAARHILPGLGEHDDAVKAAAEPIALGVIIGARFIGPPLFVTTGATPRLFGLPAIAIAGMCPHCSACGSRKTSFATATTIEGGGGGFGR